MSEKKKKKKKKRGHFTPKKEEKNGDGASLLPSPHLCLRVKTKKSKREKGEKRDFSMGTQNWRKREKREEMLSHGALCSNSRGNAPVRREWGNAPTNKGGKYLETENRYYSKKRENIQYAIFSQILYYLSFFFNILYCIRLENNSWQNIHIKIHLPIWGFEVL